jgi:hypothetical protein
VKASTGRNADAGGMKTESGYECVESDEDRSTVRDQPSQKFA